jgi:dTMP kinase
MISQLVKNPYPGRFITFEGIDGSGKSEQFKMTRDFLLNIPNLNVIFVKEPPINTIGVEIYDILRGLHPTLKLENLSELDMQRKYFLARRIQYQNINLPALRSGIHIISDRGLVSVVYGLENMNDLKRFMDIQESMFNIYNIPLITPDLNLIYDVDINTALKRLEIKGIKRDKFEQRERLERTRSNYLAITREIPNCVIIDGTLSSEEIFKITKKYIVSILNLPNSIK